MALEKGQPVIALHLKAPNDGNGNPRRLYVLLHGSGKYVGQVAAVCEEGYAGWYPHGKMVEAFKCTAAQGPAVKISATEYREWKREAKAGGYYHA